MYETRRRRRPRVRIVVLGGGKLKEVLTTKGCLLLLLESNGHQPHPAAEGQQQNGEVKSSGENEEQKGEKEKGKEERVAMIGQLIEQDRRLISFGYTTEVSERKFTSTDCNI